MYCAPTSVMLLQLRSTTCSADLSFTAAKIAFTCVWSVGAVMGPCARVIRRGSYLDVSETILKQHVVHSAELECVIGCQSVSGHAGDDGMASLQVWRLAGLLASLLVHRVERLRAHRHMRTQGCVNKKANEAQIARKRSSFPPR